TATTADSDYTATSGTLTFNPGDTTKTFNVTITNDAKNEASETYTVTISNPTNATISDATGTGTITNDDAAPSLSISDVSVAENVGAGVATFTVTLSAVSGQTVTVDYATSDGTATTADSDYTATSGTLTFNPGDTTKTFNVTITNDAKNEASETYTVTISNPSNATISDATGTGTITNDDAVPSLAVNDVTVDEDAGTATFTVTQSAVSGQTVTVDYATSNGTATAGSDYTAASGTLTFNPGDTTKTFNVTITNDTSDEADETYTVTISNPTNATISDATSIGTITDNDVTVDQTDDDNTATGFGGGSHTGTTYTSGVLTLNTTTNNAELDESWTPQWDNLVAYWKMDETSWNGTANEVIDSIGSNHGVRVGDATTTSSAKIGDYAGTFDGTGDYVQIADADNLSFASTTSKLSFSTWVYISGTTGTADQVILGKYNSNASKIEYLFVYNTTNKYLELRVSEDGTSGTFWSTRANLVFDAIGAWFHFVVTLDVGTDTVNYYINGQSYGSVNTAGASINAMENFNEPFRIATVTCLSGSTCGYLNGKIDDVAIWDTVISTDEVAIIYSRQSAKYAGEMKSRIIDSQDASASWTNLDWLTTLPFGKELPSSSESSADYSDLYSDGLMDGLVGLWHLNSNTWSDSSGLNYAGTSGGNVSISSFGLLSNAAEFDGDKDYIELPASSTILSGDTSLTLSAWFKTSLTYDTTGKGVNYGARLFSIYKTDAPAGYSSKIGLGFYGDNTDTLFIYHTPANSALTYTNSGFNDGKWHHLLCTYNATNDELKLYYDGVEVASANSITLSDAGTNLMHIGDFDPADTEGSFNGLIDEAAVWNRALDADEVLEFYRRGANRIKYQVRSCSSADCSDQDALTGDGWQGPGGNYLTYFSELYNNSSISSSCAIPQACAASELSLDGDVQTSSPSLRFDD
ncbi:MAG: hypothetical protein EBT20_15470, partial [Alphaproteobacteria bacterium]|nr:hypothetical protein [Alphaproteobacteria bacterium]